MALLLVLPAAPSAQATPLFVLQETVDLAALGLSRATSLTFDPLSGNLFLAVPRGPIAEMTPAGNVVNTFNAPGDPIDNSGLSIDPATGHLIYVNGNGLTDPEPIIEMTTSGTIVNTFSSPVQEGTGLAIDPTTENLFVSDVGLIPPGLDLVRELEQQGSAFVQINSFSFSTIFDYGDAGLEFNPFTGNLAVAGELGDNPGVIFDVSSNGTNLGPFFDTGIADGIRGLAFDEATTTLYALAEFGDKMLIFAPSNAAPDCSGATATPDTLWPPDHSFKAIEIGGVSDPDGDPVTITIDSIRQDEPVDSTGDGAFVPDGSGVGTSTAEVRAERAGDMNGRVYHIAFTVSDGLGGICAGVVTVGVPKSQGPMGGPVDDGPLFDSTVA